MKRSNGDVASIKDQERQVRPRPSQAPELPKPTRAPQPPMPSQDPMPTTPTGPQSPPGAPRKLKRSYATVWDELADEDVGVFTHPYIFPKFDNELKTHATDDTATRTTPRDPDPVRQRLDFDTEYANQPTNDIRLDGLPPVPPLPPRPGSAQFMEAPSLKQARLDIGIHGQARWNKPEVSHHKKTPSRE